MVKVHLRWCMSGFHSGHPFVYDVKENTTFGEIAQMVIATNQEWCKQGFSQTKFSTVKICKKGTTFWDDGISIGTFGVNECYLVFDASC